MSREHKYRAWCDEKKKYADGCTVYDDGSWDYYFTEYIKHCAGDGEVGYTPTEKDELEQYTGLKDKKDVEIYFDSDIVEATITDDYTGKETKISGVLYINLKRFKICMKGHEDFNLLFAEELEMTGNIHGIKL